ncbi:Type III secretion system outer membrane protein SpiA precursor [compost metagenome]
MRVISALLALVCCAGAQARTLDWSAEPFSYVAHGESLRDVLVNFAANYQSSVIVSDKVDDQVSSSFDLKDPQSFLNLVSALYSLVWYYDGAVLYVFKSTEMQTRLVQLGQVKEPQLRAALQAGGNWEPSFPWRPEPGGRLVYVSAPPRYLDMISQTVQALEQQNTLQVESSADLAVEIFPLKYAVAEDRQIKYRDDSIQAPGLASILSRVLSDANVVAVNGEQAVAGGTAATRQVVVQADPSLNAIIVRDSQERMPMYRRLITALDRPSARIEVGLSIVDINAENLSELGVDWQAGIGLGNNRLIEIRTTGGKPDKEGAVGSLVDGRGLNYLMAKITLLQSQGLAQIGSRPTLLTQENTAAVIDHSETYYVKVTGERVAELKAITYGTMLKMTPRVVQMGEQPEISLSLHIEDGNQKPNSSGPDGIPTINRTVIDTVARVGLGQSLLIGGIHRDELNESVRKVPLLGDIPYLGALFRFNYSSSRRAVRLFLIEPRLIDSSLARDVALMGGRSDMQGLLAVDELSNNSLALQSLLNTAQCQALAPAQEAQQILRQAGKDSSLTACKPAAGGTGWRVTAGPCVEGKAQCVRAQKSR